MHVGIDGGTWANARGYGRFTRELVRGLLEVDQRNRYSLFLDSATRPDDLPTELGVISVRVRESPSRAASADGYRSPGDMWAFSRAIARAPVDLVFFPSVYTFVPLTGPVPVMVGIHDVIAERFPQHVFSSRRARLFWTLKTQWAVRQATRVLTVSEHARRGVQAYFHLPRAKLCVTHEAPAAAFAPIADTAAVAAALGRYGLAPDTRFVMYFGGITPHKNLSMLVRVFAALVRESRLADVKLVIAGDYSRDVYLSAYPALRAEVDAICGESVIFTGHVDDQDAARLLNAAQVCVLPSLDEGFGLPGIEAAACGTPLIATVESAMPEWLGDAAVYIDPMRPEDLRQALERVLGDAELRSRMRTRGLERARQLTWPAAAQKVLNAFEAMYART